MEFFRAKVPTLNGWIIGLKNALSGIRNNNSPENFRLRQHESDERAHTPMTVMMLSTSFLGVGMSLKEFFKN